MKKQRIILELEEEDHGSRVDGAALLRDALHDFQRLRTPAGEYVSDRYREMGWSPEMQAVKEAEVADRLSAAGEMRQSMAVEILRDAPASELAQKETRTEFTLLVTVPVRVAFKGLPVPLPGPLVTQELEALLTDTTDGRATFATEQVEHGLTALAAAAVRAAVCTLASERHPENGDAAAAARRDFGRGLQVEWSSVASDGLHVELWHEETP